MVSLNRIIDESIAAEMKKGGGEGDTLYLENQQAFIYIIKCIIVQLIYSSKGFVDG